MIKSPPQGDAELNKIASKRTTSSALRSGQFGRRNNLEILSNFEGEHGWSAGTVDTTNYQYGTQGLKVTSSNNIATNINKAIPYNFKDKLLFIHFFVDNVENLADVAVYIEVTTGFTKFISIGLEADYPNARHIQTGWNTVILTYPNFINTTATTQIDLETCVGLRLRAKGKAGTTVNVTFDMVGLIPNPASKGIIVVNFDDGLASLITQAKPIMSKYNIPGTAYIVPTLIGTTNYITLDGLLKLQDVGWDIGSHTYTHSTSDMRNLTIDEFKAELLQSRQWLEDNGIWSGMDHFAYSGGQNNLEMRNEVRKIYATGRSGNIPGSHIQSVLLEDQYRLRTTNVIGVSTFNQIKEKIDGAINYKGFGLILFHNIIDGTPGVNDTALTIFTQIIEYLDANRANVDIVTMSEAMNLIARYRTI